VSTEPERIRWAVEALDVQPDERLLELGCGGGLAVSLVCEQLTAGMITGVDRSPLQIERAARRNAACVAAGKAAFLVADLEAVPSPGHAFETIFAINVNHFWTRPKSAAPEALARLLVPGGRLELFYETPSPGRTESIETILRKSLADEPFVQVGTTSSPLLRVTARRA
jgi:cyclopropane fatty-acyl-phospholipid synthase-like methyltransferase